MYGQAKEGQLLTKAGMQTGQALLLTKPLGTGTILAAHMRGGAKGRWVQGAVESMTLSNGGCGGGGGGSLWVGGRAGGSGWGHRLGSSAVLRCPLAMLGASPTQPSSSGISRRRAHVRTRCLDAAKLVPSACRAGCGGAAAARRHRLH